MMATYTDELLIQMLKDAIEAYTLNTSFFEGDVALIDTAKYLDFCCVETISHSRVKIYPNSRDIKELMGLYLSILISHGILDDNIIGSNI